MDGSHIQTRFSWALVISQLSLSRCGQCDIKPSSRHGCPGGEGRWAGSWRQSCWATPAWTGNCVNKHCEYWNSVCAMWPGSISQNYIKYLDSVKGASYSTFTDKTKHLERYLFSVNYEHQQSHAPSVNEGWILEEIRNGKHLSTFLYIYLALSLINTPMKLLQPQSFRHQWHYMWVTRHRHQWHSTHFTEQVSPELLSRPSWSL